MIVSRTNKSIKILSSFSNRITVVLSPLEENGQILLYFDFY